RGGHTERITLARSDISPAVPTSRSPAASARATVAALRPADAHSTVSPRLLRQPPTAAPISPGCSTPITFSSTITSGTSLTHPAMAWAEQRTPGGACTFGKAFSLPNAALPSGIYHTGHAPGPGVGAPGSGVNRSPLSTPNSVP